MLSPIEVLWVPAHVGPAAPLFFAFAVGGSLALRRRPPALFLVLTVLAILYVFAPSLGIPDELYYVNVMAGPTRTWAIQNDPNHEWMLQP